MGLTAAERKRLPPTLRVARVFQQAPTWFGVGFLLLAIGDHRARSGVARGAAGSALACVVANLILKPIVHRRRPALARLREHPPLTSSFPSGHSASQLAFSLGVAEDSPALLGPVFALTAASHWSLVRSHSHYLTDVMAGWVVGALANLAVMHLPWDRLETMLVHVGEELRP